jgi:hypothetical protein
LGEREPVQTTEAVMNRAFELAEEMREDDDAVAELVTAALGKRVSLVIARQRITDELSGEPASELTKRAVSLIERAIVSVSDSD